jgi:hypothetical protein
MPLRDIRNIISTCRGIGTIAESSSGWGGPGLSSARTLHAEITSRTGANMTEPAHRAEQTIHLVLIRHLCFNDQTLTTRFRTNGHDSSTLAGHCSHAPLAANSKSEGRREW